MFLLSLSLSVGQSIHLCDPVILSACWSSFRPNVHITPPSIHQFVCFSRPTHHSYKHSTTNMLLQTQYWNIVLQTQNCKHSNTNVVLQTQYYKHSTTNIVLQNLAIGLDKKDKQIFVLILGGPYGPPNLGSAQKSENMSNLGLYCTANKTLRNVLLVTIQEPLTRPFQNTHYYSQNDNFSIVSVCSKFGNFQMLTKK